MMNRNTLLFALVALFGTIVAVADARADDRPVVYASNYPLYFFATEIVGGKIDIRLPEMQGDPAFWAPDGDQAAALQKADLILLNGAGYESWLDFVSLRDERLVDTTEDLADRLLPLEEATVHQHGPEGEHSHAGTAFTTWLDPQLAVAQAQAISAALAGLAPAHEAEFNKHLAELQQKLEQLDHDLEQAFATLGDQAVIFSHPVYQYLESRYSINGQSVHWEPDTVPNTRQWIDFQKLLAGHPSKLLIWEGTPLAETVDKLEQQGIVPVIFEPAGNRPDQGDYLEVMERNRQRLLNALKDN